MQGAEFHTHKEGGLPAAAREGAARAQPMAAGIVAEYNPFHSGHAWMIDMLRRGGIHTVVCALSGGFVQRAEPALYPTHVRARAAIAGGADIVLRLPAPWACASAEGFAEGAVGMLAALGCVDILAFGAETAEVGKLIAVAEVLLVDGFSSLLRARLEKGTSFAAARAAAAELLLPGAGEVLRGPNNILAVEYIKALRGKLRGHIRAMLPPSTAAFPLPVPLALPRVGAAHDGPASGGFASASSLRELALEQGAEALAPWVPEECLEVYRQAERDGETIDAGRWEAALLARLRGKSSLYFALHAGAGEGLEARMAAAAKQATGAEELYRLAKTKRFAHSRVRRLALSAALDLPGDVPLIPPFAQVLAANERGLAFLRRAKESALIPVSTSLAKLEKGQDAGRIAAAEAAAEDLYALCRKSPAAGGGAYTRAAYFARRKRQD